MKITRRERRIREEALDALEYAEGVRARVARIRDLLPKVSNPAARAVGGLYAKVLERRAASVTARALEALRTTEEPYG